MELLYTLKLENGSTFEARGQEDLEISVPEQCVFRKDFYQDIGEAVAVSGPLPPEKKDIPAIQRKAVARDFAMMNENSARSRSALRTAVSSVERLGLPMKLLNAHYSMDGKLLTIQFTADGRVDFRELVKELSHIMNTRIELRQIGVRDETAIFGGIAVCGQVLCCSRFLKEFNSINVRMAKDQDLSLTPATISGVCGRLKCCLKYEHEGYLELEKGMPRRGEYCECPHGRGRVCDRNLLTGEVSVQIEGGNTFRCPRAEVTVVKPPERERPPRRDGAPGAPPAGNSGTPGPRKPRPPRDRKGPRPAGGPRPDKCGDESGNTGNAENGGGGAESAQ